MRYERRSNKSGTDIYYSFVSYSKGKRFRLSREEIRNRFGKDITNEIEAKLCLNSLEQEFETEKKRVQQLISWKNNFYRFDEMVALYVKRQKKKAPNSWRNNQHYLSCYVMPFFLSDQKNISSLSNWHNHFEEYREYLLNEAKLIRSKLPLSYGSRNHAIKSLNTFLKFLYQEGVLDTLRLCEYFEEHLLRQRTIDDVVSFEEFKSIEGQLNLDGHKLEADFFRFLYFSGMRINEGAGVSLADVYHGEISKKAFNKRLETNKIKYFGYVLLKSQPSGENKTIRDSNTNLVNRKPLKGRKVMTEKDCRIVPITDENLWEKIMTRLREQHDLWKKGIYGSNPSNYLLFDGFNRTTSTIRLKSAFEKVGISFKTWHCLRHTRGTELFGETGDRELAKMWLGHGSDKVFERYNHAYEELVRTSQRTGLKKNEKFDDWFFGESEEYETSISVFNTKISMIDTNLFSRKNENSI